MDYENLKNYCADIEEDSLRLEDTVNNLISNVTSSLDDEMKDVYTEIINVEYPSIDIIEKHFLKLTSIIYFVIEKVEKFGIRDDVGKAINKFEFNKIYINCSTNFEGTKKPTAAELTSTAENETLYENTASLVHTRAYKICKAKIDAAQGMVSTLSKIMSKRMQEEQFTANNEAKQEKKILNEEFY